MHRLHHEEMEDLSPVQFQQAYFENMLGCDWVKYEKKDFTYMLQNVAFALYGEPSGDGTISEGDQLEGYTARQTDKAKKILKKILEQKKYSLKNDTIIMSIQMVICCKPKSNKTSLGQSWVGLHRKPHTEINMWYTAVFRVRKCLHLDGGQGCSLYIDEEARVYANWKTYLKENMLPHCVLVVPEDGHYHWNASEMQEGDMPTVMLSVVRSPALEPKDTILNVADHTTTAASIGALGVFGVSMLTPVGPLVLAGASAVTVAAGLYGFIRSSLHLHDRRIHKQSISPTSPSARGSYINIAASTVGIAAGASSKILARAAAVGANMTTAGKALETSVDVLRYLNLVAGGGGLVNSITHLCIKYHKYGEAPTSLELFQFTASTLFFASAVVTNRAARSIIEEAQGDTIAGYRATIRSRHRKMFDHITAARNGTIAGNTEIIREIRMINSNEQYRSNVLMNGNVDTVLKLPLNQDGQVALDLQHTFAPIETSSANILKVISSVSNAIVPSVLTVAEKFRPEEFISIGSRAFRVSQSGMEYMAKLLQQLSEAVYDALMTVACNMLAALVPNEIKKILILFIDGDPIAAVVKYLFKYIKKRCEPSRNEENVTFEDMIKQFFHEGRVRSDMIVQACRRFMRWVELLLSQRGKKEMACGLCGGVFYLH